MASVAKRKWTKPDGTTGEAWTVRYKDNGGSYRQRTFERKKEAEAFRATAQVELQKGSHIAHSQTITVAKLIDRYIESCELRHEQGRFMSDSHIRTVRLMLRKHVVPYIGEVRLIDLSYDLTDTWITKLSKVPTLSPGTVKRIIHLFKVAVDFAQRREWVHRNVVDVVRREWRGGQRQPIRTFTEAEARSLILAAGERPPNFTQRATDRMQCMVYLAAFCGLRLGEITGLKVENLDFTRATVKVRHSLTDRDVLKEPKTRAGVRNVPMPPVLVDMLKRWLARWYVENDRGLVFRMAGGGFQSPQNFHANYWRKLLERAGLGPDAKGRRFHFHALRHFCASMMVKQCVPLTDVAELLGHSSFDVTLQVYTHALMDSSHRAAIMTSLAREVLGAPESDALIRMEPANDVKTITYATA